MTLKAPKTAYRAQTILRTVPRLLQPIQNPSKRKRTNRQRGWPMKYWEIIITNFSATMDGIAAVSQARIATGDNFGLWPQSVRTLDASLCTLMTWPPHF
jgi:hypothetical protein